LSYESGHLLSAQDNGAPEDPARNDASGEPPPDGLNPDGVAADGRTVFRRTTPVVCWWIWVALAVLSVIQVAVAAHDYFSIEVVAGLLAVTGVAYASALRPVVIADSEGVLVRNPLRDYVIRWGAVNGVYLRDSVELACARPTPLKDKTVYCWALYSGRRRRQRAEQFGWRSRIEAVSRPVADTTAPMAAELGRRSTEARSAGAQEATLESRWAWLPIALIVVPAAALLALVLAA
jgi:Bacterial PH domain